MSTLKLVTLKSSIDTDVTYVREALRGSGEDCSLNWSGFRDRLSGQLLQLLTETIYYIPQISPAAARKLTRNLDTVREIFLTPPLLGAEELRTAPGTAAYIGVVDAALAAVARRLRLVAVQFDETVAEPAVAFAKLLATAGLSTDSDDQCRLMEQRGMDEEGIREVMAAVRAMILERND